ncbi:hypothetical protein LTR85_002180 [Meristemomyces frigidus]|nr:hypothetical protein LTR85_002180 [Meristemomyces frigidus]
MAAYTHTAALWTDREFLLEDYHGHPAEISKDKVEIGHGGFIFVDCDCSYDGLEDGCACHADLNTTVRPLVIASDGGCRLQRSPNAFAGIGVYVGEGSYANVSELMPPTSESPTGQRAELTAALRALQTAMRIKSDGHLPAVRTVVLKADCATITHAMIRSVWAWRENGYMTGNGYPVLDRDLFWQLEEAVIRLEKQYGVETRFWWVPRENNKEADSLARRALQAEANRRKAIYDVRELERHAKRKRGGEDAIDQGNAKRTRVQQQPALPPPAITTQYMQTPVLLQQPQITAYYGYAQPATTAPQPPHRYLLPTIPALAPLPAPTPLPPSQSPYRYTLPTIPAFASLPAAPPPPPIVPAVSPWTTYSPATPAAPVSTYSAPVQFGQPTPLQTAARFFHNIAQFLGWC